MKSENLNFLNHFIYLWTRFLNLKYLLDYLLFNLVFAFNLIYTVLFRNVLPLQSTILKTLLPPSKNIHPSQEHRRSPSLFPRAPPLDSDFTLPCSDTISPVAGPLSAECCRPNPQLFAVEMHSGPTTRRTLCEPPIQAGSLANSSSIRKSAVQIGDMVGYK